MKLCVWHSAVVGGRHHWDPELEADGCQSPVVMRQEDTILAGIPVIAPNRHSVERQHHR
jgi:hypothetical protein